MDFPFNPQIQIGLGRRSLYDGTGRYYYVRGYSEWGCYPMYYVTADCGILCAACVEENIVQCSDQETKDTWEGKQWFVIAHAANYENSTLDCDHCNMRIESAYAEE